MGAIAGICTNKTYPAEHLQKMLDCMKSRGIEKTVIKISDSIWFGYRKHQNEESGFVNTPKLCVIFDGYIINKHELISEMKEHFDYLPSSVDIVYASYVKWGVDAIKKLDGAFAIAIWDGYKNQIILARDNFGIKPLYYYLDNHRLIFSSEIKGIFVNKDIKIIPNKNVFAEYIIFRFVQGEETFFKQIFEIEPGTFCITSLFDFALYKEKFYHLFTQSKQFPGEEEAIKIFIRIFQKTLQNYLELFPISKTGLFLSGGVDSALIAAITQQFKKNSINTYTIRFKEREYDESKHAKIVSQQLGIPHKIILLDEYTYATNLPQAIWNADEPLRYPGSVSFYAISKSLSKTISQILIGEGVDSFVAGHPACFIITVTKINKFLKKIALSILVKIPSCFFFGRLRNKKNKLLLPLQTSTHEYIVFSTIYSSPEEVLRILKSPCKEFLYKKFELLKQINKKDPKECLSYFQQISFTFKISETEKQIINTGKIPLFPFLNNEIISFINSLPMSLKVNGFKTKYLIKKTAEHFFSKDFIYRKKSGFGTPLEYWFRNKKSLGKYLQMLEEDRTLDRGIFNPDELIKIVHQFKHGKRPPEDYDGLLWTIVNLELWHRIFIDQDYEFEYC